MGGKGKIMDCLYKTILKTIPIYNDGDFLILLKVFVNAFKALTKTFNNFTDALRMRINEGLKGPPITTVTSKNLSVKFYFSEETYHTTYTND